MVTLMWALEQIDVHLFGSTPRASDSRIVISFLFNSGSIIAYSFALKHLEEPLFGYLICGALAFISSHNIWHSLGLIKPYKIINEKQIQQKDYAEIVFSEYQYKRNSSNIPIVLKSGQAQQEHRRFNLINIIVGVILRSIFMLGAILVTICIIADQIYKSLEEYSILLAILFVIAAIVFSIISMIISLVYRRSCFRILKCCHKQGEPVIAIQIFKNLIIILLTLAISIFMYNADTNFQRGNFVYANYFLLFRIYNRIFHAPLAATLETAILVLFIAYEFGFQESVPLNSLIIHLVVHRAQIFINKLDYILVSIITAYKNKKQRFKFQTICFLIQFTFLLPILIFTLIITTLLNTATIPYLGFAYFMIGYPKPQRQWSEITPVQASPTDQRSDGHLYQAMQIQLSRSLQSMMNSDLLQFRAGSFYLMKNEKMIALVQVLEKGNNYMIYTVKGTELQETTVCHAEENDNLNQIGEAIFKQKKINTNYAISVSPFKEVGFSIYDDQKVSLTGIIDNPEFAQMLRKAYLRIIAMQVNDVMKRNLNIKFYKIFKGDLSQKENESINKFFEPSFINYLQVDTQNFSFTNQPIPKFVEVKAPQQIQPSQIVNQRSLNTSENVPFRQPSNMSGHSAQGPTNFLSMLEQKQNTSQIHQSSAVQGIVQQNAPAIAVNSSISVPSRRRPDEEFKEQNQVHKQVIQERDELDDLISPQKKPVGKSLLPPVEKYNKEMSHNDLDDLDDLLGDSKAKPKSKLQPIKQNQNNKKLDDPWGDFGNSQENKVTKNPQPTNMNDEFDFEGGEQDFEDFGNRSNNNNSQLRNQSSLNHQGQTNMRGGQSDFQRLLFESYQLVFKDQFGNIPNILHNLFKGEFYRDMESSDFVQSRDKNILFMKYLFLQSMRLAFHYCVECFIMGEMELGSPQDFEKEIRQIEQEWFFAGEDYLWNQGIEYNFPNLERIISKKGQYFAHRLKYGLSDETKFQVYQFRREVVRGIWGNINMELLYYTNANDERFSIQAEKDILRNLLVQLAEIPLGYPVYSSGSQIIYY